MVCGQCPPYIYMFLSTINYAVTDQEQQFSEFQAWIEQKFNVSYSQPWEKIIRFFSPDETTSLHQFFSLFNEFTEYQRSCSASASLSH